MGFSGIMSSMQHGCGLSPIVLRLVVGTVLLCIGLYVQVHPDILFWIRFGTYLGLVWLLLGSWLHRFSVLLVFVSFPPISAGFFVAPFIYSGLFFAMREDIVKVGCKTVSNRPLTWLRFAILIGLGQTYVLSCWATSCVVKPIATGLTLWLTGICLWSILLGATNYLLKRRSFIALFMIPIIFVVFDLARARLPGLNLPYHLTSHAAALNPFLLSITSWVGGSGISLLCVSTSLFGAYSFRSGFRFKKAAAVLLFALVPHLLYSLNRPVRVEVYSEACELKVTIAQDSDAVEYFCSEYVDPELSKKRRSHFLSIVRDSTGDLVVLPESAVLIPDQATIVEGRLTISDLLRENESRDQPLEIIAGFEQHFPMENGCLPKRRGVLAISSSGKSVFRDKVFLAPMGESQPFLGWPLLSRFGMWLEDRSFCREVYDTRGDIEVLGVHPMRVGVCFESMIPGIWSSKEVEGDSVLQIFVSDVSAFQFSKIERSQSRIGRRLLAAEQSLSLLNVANGGSEFLDSHGNLIHEISPGRSSIDWVLPLIAHEESFYAKYIEGSGWYILMIFTAFFVFLGFLMDLRFRPLLDF